MPKSCLSLAEGLSHVDSSSTKLIPFGRLTINILYRRDLFKNDFFSEASWQRKLHLNMENLQYE